MTTITKRENRKMPLVPMRQFLDEATRGGYGVGAVNVDTDSRLAVTGAIRKVFAESPEKFDPRDYLKPARAAMQELIAGRMHDFGQAGHAADYEPLSLEEMREGYAAAAAAV